MKTREETTDPLGRRTYSPDEEVARRAPAVICGVASRTIRLRKELKRIQDEGRLVLSLVELEVLLRDYLAPLPFESELLSGDICKVDDAIRNFPV